MNANTLKKFSCLLLAIGIGLGAIGAHALKNKITPEHLETYKTGVFYLQLQALALLAYCAHFTGSSNEKKLLLAQITGMFIFSGGCIIYALTLSKIFVMIVPIGGILMITTWFGLALVKKNNS